MQLTTDKQARKEQPIARGVLDYFGKAIAEVANVSHIGNQQHNPGQPMHWAREKSTDHADCIARHLIERGTIDDDGLRHSAKIAWRALALLQLEIEADQAGEDRNQEAIRSLQAGEFDRPVNLAEHDVPRRVYISGPMRGIADQNFPAFDKAAVFFRTIGYAVINPADADRCDGGRVMTQKDYAIRDTHALNHCTHIAMLPGWEKSIGALAEFFYARWIGLKILDAHTGGRLMQVAAGQLGVL